MGYTTDFKGSFKLSTKLEKDHKTYLERFSESRRMKRNPDLLGSILLPAVKNDFDGERDDMPEVPWHVTLGLGAGVEGGYFVDGAGWAGQASDKSILDYNTPPKGQPGLWCQWVPNKSGTAIVWAGSEKFYNYVEWLEYLIEHFLNRWTYTLDGKVTYQGEADGDKGYIQVVKNKVSVFGKSTTTEIKRALKDLRERYPLYGFEPVVSFDKKNHYCIHAFREKGVEKPKYGPSYGHIPVIEKSN